MVVEFDIWFWQWMQNSFAAVLVEENKGLCEPVFVEKATRAVIAWALARVQRAGMLVVRRCCLICLAEVFWWRHKVAPQNCLITERTSRPPFHAKAYLFHWPTRSYGTQLKSRSVVLSLIL